MWREKCGGEKRRVEGGIFGRGEDEGVLLVTRGHFPTSNLGAPPDG